MSDERAAGPVTPSAGTAWATTDGISTPSSASSPELEHAAAAGTSERPGAEGLEGAGDGVADGLGEAVHAVRGGHCVLPVAAEHLDRAAVAAAARAGAVDGDVLGEERDLRARGGAEPDDVAGLQREDLVHGHDAVGDLGADGHVDARDAGADGVGRRRRRGRRCRRRGRRSGRGPARPRGRAAAAP